MTSGSGEGTALRRRRRLRRGLIVLLLAGFVWVSVDIIRWSTRITVWKRVGAGGTISRREWNLWRRETREVRSWNAETGFLVYFRRFDPAPAVLITEWDEAGRLLWQFRTANGLKTSTESPMRDEAIQQDTPFAPWLEAGLTADEWWERVDPSRSWWRMLWAP